ncbi:sesquipedalian-1 isoform X1 [Glossina fuscipes]|uniref:Sesquipedalian-1 isoform X1 n=1 Tax=Glossina fuscipes TaxID=7396 RepID=A0A9C5ZJ02_9MUSC|nr:sesquipedalian-1 isoform X1 [Glossina fuscipes]
MTHLSGNSTRRTKMKINEKNLCVFATSPPFDKEGFLNKRGEVNKSFQRRYFVLKGNLLFYFEKQGDKEPLGLIIVEGCTIELSEESDRYCFEIAFNGNRTYVLSADSQESMESWMKALTCAGYEYKKLMVAELQRQLEEIEGSKNKVLTDSLKANADVSIPKPPPRRQNPFNRPAPPPPSGNLGTNPTFSTNGNQIVSKQRTATDIQQVSSFAGKCACPTPPPTGSSSSSKARAIVTEKSEFYVDEQPMQHKQQSLQFPIDHLNAVPSVHPNDSYGTTVTHNRNKSTSFEQIHETFRKVVMKDVLAYRAQQDLNSRPLIEL